MMTSALLSKVPGLLHAFGNRAEPVPAITASAWSASAPVWKQVHGIDLAWITGPHQDCGMVDAMATSLKQQPIGVRSADCVPILMAEKSGAHVAAIHAGWKGTLSKIVASVVPGIFSKTKTNSRDWVAALGPSIQSCCFEVAKDLADDFENKFSHLDSKIIRPQERRIDLHQVNSLELKRLGVAEVDLLPFCTRCNSNWFSFRRDKNDDRQFSIVSLGN